MFYPSRAIGNRNETWSNGQETCDPGGSGWHFRCVKWRGRVRCARKRSKSQIPDRAHPGKDGGSLSRRVGDKLPFDLHERLAGNNLHAYAEKAILICTVDANGRPHPAILSYQEVVAKDGQNVRLAIYRDSTTSNNLRRNGKLTVLIIDERLAYYIKGTAEELAWEMTCAPYNSKFNLRVEQVLADEANEEFEPNAYVRTGVTYRRPAEPPQAKEILLELMT